MTYKLTYFKMRGRAECIRLIFAAAGKTYQQIGVDVSDWPEVKKGTPWGQMPVLDTDEGRLAQTITICRYLGRKFGLVGNSDWEAAKCDEYVDAMSDLSTEWAKYFFEKDPATRTKLHEDFKTKVPQFLSKFEKIKASSGSPFLIGQSLTWADIFIADKLERITGSEGPEVLEPYPNLKGFMDEVYRQPKIKAYVSQRPPE